jgi:hypothetical protein
MKRIDQWNCAVMIGSIAKIPDFHRKVNTGAAFRMGLIWDGIPKID